MCSVDEDDLDGEKFMEEAPSTTLENETCKKCRLQKATLVLRKKDHYCDECFTASVNHKFRSTFGKSRLIKPGEKVLIAHSGDVDSSTLIHLIHLGISENTHKKLQFQPIVLHIDERCISNMTKEESQNTLSNIESSSKSYNIPFHSVCISQTMMENVQFSNDNLATNEQEIQLKQLLSTIKTPTGVRSMMKKLKKNLLLHCSKILNCSCILLAETATTLAANLLASIAFGGGPHISSDIGFADTRDDTVKILRPLKDLTSEDIGLYNKIYGLSHFVNKDLQDSQYTSIQSLTEHFIKNLQVNFPATVSTVMKTGEKIENSSTESKDDLQCAMCQSKLDTQISICSSAEATLFSKETSNETTPHLNLTEQGQDCSNCTCGSAGTKSLTREDINLFMCYSCRLIIRDIKNVDFLPPTLLTNIKNKKRLQKIKSSIQDYLL